MADTTSTTLTELIQAAIGQARVVESPGAFLKEYVTVRPQDAGKGGATFPIYDEEVFASVAEGTDLTGTAFDTTAVTITPGEAGLMADLTDVASGRAGMQAAVDIGRVMGEGYQALVNRDIYALGDGFSTAIGTTDTDITEALIQNGVAQLRANKAPGRLFMPVTPWVMEDLLGLYSTNTNNTPASLREQATLTGTLPTIHGVTPLLITNLAAGTGTGAVDEADTKSCIFSEAAIGYVEEWDFRIEEERNASKRSTELVATASYGVGEIKDGWGIELLLDNKD